MYGGPRELKALQIKKTSSIWQNTRRKYSQHKQNTNTLQRDTNHIGDI